MDNDESTYFLNVDLDIYAAQPLDDLAAAFGKTVRALFVGRERRRYSAHLALRASGYGQSPDRIILGFVRLIEKLPRSQRSTWNRALLRQFNIGIQAEKQPRSFELPVKAKTLAAAARVGADLVVTVYAPNPELANILRSVARASHKRVQPNST